MPADIIHQTSHCGGGRSGGGGSGVGGWGGSGGCGSGGGGRIQDISVALCTCAKTISLYYLKKYAHFRPSNPVKK